MWPGTDWIRNCIPGHWSSGFDTTFRSRFPGVEVAMREMSTPAQLDALENRTLDFGFVRIPASSQELVVWPLFQDRLVLAIGPHSGGRARGGLASFSRGPFICVAREGSARLFDH